MIWCGQGAGSNMEKEKNSLKRNSYYFEDQLFRIKDNARRDRISPERLGQITQLVNSLPEMSITEEEEGELLERAELPIKEFSYFFALLRIRGEITEALEGGSLSSVEAEKWKREFGFSESEEE